MIKNELPTFRRWGKKLLEWRRAIIVALLILGVHRATAYCLERYYAVVLPCDQPCQDGADCDPFEFEFEIRPNKITLDQPSFIWYSARLKNRSCRRLKSIYVKGFLDSTDLTKSIMGLWVSVSGPDGREIERLRVPWPDGGIVWEHGGSQGKSISMEGTIYPYQPDYARMLKLRDEKKLDNDWIDLEPGEKFETITPLLRPYRKVMKSVRTEDGGFADGFGWVPVENPPKFPNPPEGFNLLDRYKFARAGRYTIKAGFTGKVSGYRVYSRWDNRSRAINLIFSGIMPALWESEEREVDLTATPVALEVVR